LLFISVVLSGMMINCGSDPTAEIKRLEKKISDENFSLDETGIGLANQLIQAYIAFADSHKDSPQAPGFLYRAADLSLNINQSKQSVDLYNRIIYQYPDYEKVPECLFLMGYIYENYFQELGKAKEIYESFLSRYPNHDFADDARISIENLGKSPEELIRFFEEKNKALSDTVNS
jgi:TolA-binding protein